MAVIIKDLGVVTAYAYAVAGGYVGTEAEFTELLGNIAEDLETIENLTVSATTLPPGSQATASYSNGHLTLGIPQGIKGDKGDKGDKGNTGATGNGIASITLTSTSGAVKTYTITFTDGTTTTFDVTDGEVTTESLLETLEEYAKIDGLYEDMTVGNAEQLIASDYVTDKAPYLFRKTGGSTDVGNREYDTLVGASAVWNQLVKNGDFSDGTTEWSSYLATLSASNGVLTATSTSAEYSSVQARQLNMSIKAGRKYLVNADIMTSVSTTGTKIGHSGIGTTIISKALTANTWTNFASVFIVPSDADRILFYLDNSATHPVGSTMSLKNVNLVDLTTFFGSSTIPDYVYSLEQSTAGSGVAWLRQYFPKLFEYHEYDAGTLKSVEGVESHDMVGFNQWDESTAESNYIYSKAGVKTAGNNLSCGMIRVLPSTSYYLKAPHYESIWNAVFFDAEKNGLNDAIQVTSGQSGKLFTTPSNCHYVGLNMQTSDKNDICINLSNSGYRNGEYEPYWKRSYPLDSTWVGRGIYKLGSDGKPYADGDIYASDGTVIVNYTQRAYQSGDESLADAITDGTNTIVKLSTPTTTTLTPFQSPQICDDFGTEEYVTDCLIPIGHETKYPANLRDKVQHLPDLSNLGNGNYIINQTGTQMSLAPITSIIPAVPTTNGTYKLKCTVSGGQATLTWEVDS